MMKLVWFGIAIVGAAALGMIASARGETINSIWLVAAALCVYAIAYRFYALWISTKILVTDNTRATPAERFDNGLDFTPTNKWVTFGHHFAAIAGPGPLVGPTLAAQFGYLPGTIWILIGAVLGGCVQDMTTLFFSTRRDGRSLGQMARDELGPLGGAAALIGTLAIMVILISVLGLVVVNALKHSPWGTSTVMATIPVAILVGLYMRHIRPGKVLEGSLIGVSLLLFSVASGGWIDHSSLRHFFDFDSHTLVWLVIGYGFLAAILPVWLLLAPRDYLSTYMKLGTVIALALAILIMHPEIRMPAVTSFVDGTGPIFAGKLFPFVFITIACGAISGFHALVSSGTTPKLIANEEDIPMIGYGGMILESFVAIMAMVAATVLDPGVFFAINSPPGLVGTGAMAAAKISSWGFPVSMDRMQQLASEMGEKTLFARTGGAPSLAVGMASIFGNAFGRGLLSIWYHFAIMFEAVFILTTLDAGTRVGRFMLQDMLGNLYKPMGRTSWLPSVLVSSAAIVASWGYFLYIGVLDPYGGVNLLWPLFGISNQMLAAIALSVGTGILIKSGKARYAWVTGIPLAWLCVITTSAAWEKIMSPDIRIGFFAAADHLSELLSLGKLSPEKASVAPKLIFNMQLDGVITIFFFVVLWIVVFEMLRIGLRKTLGFPIPPVSESPHIPSRLVEDWVRD